jgi:uncharacterized protein
MRQHTASQGIVKSLPMRAPCNATLLRIFVGYDDTFDDKPLHDQIILKARDTGIAGATVTRGMLAYGPVTQKPQNILGLSEDLPIVIDIVDDDEKIRAFLPVVDEMIDSGLVITQKVLVIRYGRKATTQPKRNKKR